MHMQKAKKKKKSLGQRISLNPLMKKWRLPLPSPFLGHIGATASSEAPQNTGEATIGGKSIVLKLRHVKLGPGHAYALTEF